MSDFPIGTFDEGREVTHQDIKELVQQITSLQRDKAWLESSIAGLGNLMAEDQKQITELQHENAELKRIIAESKEKPIQDGIVAVPVEEEHCNCHPETCCHPWAR